jgi:alanyl-tRNA synthetase
MKEIERELAALKSAKALASASALLTKFEVISSAKVLLTQVDDGISADDLRTMSLDLRNRDSRSVVGLASVDAGRVTLVVAVSEALRAESIKAGALVKIGSTVLGGGGGGKDDFAQGGGSDPLKIADAISEMRKALNAALVK